MGWFRYNCHAKRQQQSSLFLLLSACLGPSLALAAGQKGPDSNVQKSGPALQDSNTKCNPLAYPTALGATAPANTIYIMFQHNRIQFQKIGLGHSVTGDSNGGLGY